MNEFTLRSITETDQDWVASFATEQWGADLMVAHGDSFYISQLPGFVAEINGEPAGLITYHITNDQCEITSLDSVWERIGIGGALVEAVKQVALQAGCKRLFLITTNDNTEALRFYQRRGFELSALHRGAVNESRKIKPEIPLIGCYGIPIRDEIELEMNLSAE